MNSWFCYFELQFQIFKSIFPNKLVNKCTCYIVTRLFVSLTFIENGLITNKNIFMYKIPACKIPFLCYWHLDRNKATEHFQNECFDRQSCNRKQSFRKCRCSECLCSELLFQLNLCHILSLFTWLFLLPCVSISHSSLPFGSCTRCCCDSGPLLLSALA